MSGQGCPDDVGNRYNQRQDNGERGLFGDIAHGFQRRQGQSQQPMPQPQQSVTQMYQPQLYGLPQQSTQAQSQYNRPPSPYQGPVPQPSSGGAFIFDKLSTAIHQVGYDVKTKLSGPGEVHSHTHATGMCVQGSHDGHQSNRFMSFAPERQQGNAVKWYIDACSYMWAVSVALEQARESIWILDWWLSPELYLRRPPAKYEGYRLDHMLKAAAERGVKVNIIVYKEVTQALTRKYIKPSLSEYLISLLPRPGSDLDRVTGYLSRLGLSAVFGSLEHLERTQPLIDPPLTVCSYHTKHALEDLHPNIAVFRHPDHLPDTQVLNSSFLSSLQNIKLTAATAGQLSGDALKAMYGVTEDTVLYWAHHEKLCIVDGKTAFMGGIDLCYGRWDTNQHCIADCHPSDMSRVCFPGQDYNNARIMDFQDVTNWQNNKLDRTKYPRMGWTDLSISLQGNVVDDLREHFIQRWNFICNEKYDLKNIGGRYQRIAYIAPPGIPQSSYPSLKQLPGQTGQQLGQGSASATSYGGQASPHEVQPQTFPPPAGASKPVRIDPSNQYFPPPPAQSNAGQSGNVAAIQIGPEGRLYAGHGATSTGALPTQIGHPIIAAQQAQGGYGSQHQQDYQGGIFPPPPAGAPTTSDLYGQQAIGQTQHYPSHGQAGQNYPTAGNSRPYFDPPPGQDIPGQGSTTRGPSDLQYSEHLRGLDPSGEVVQGGDRGLLSSDDSTKASRRPTPSSGKQGGSLRDQLLQRAQQGLQQIDSRYGSQIQGGLQKLDSRLGTHTTQYGSQILGQSGQGNQAYEHHIGQKSGMSCQIVRSASRWSHGVPIEHSIANAYIEIIRHSQHFIYIENQFFITATSEKQKPIKNKIGAALVERILRAARSRQNFKVIVCMPAIPAFAGDLRSDDALSTRAIMEFQYNSISRGGNSIYQSIAREGYNPLDYIRFYNLRNYDRINVSAAMAEAERQSGVTYSQAQHQYDQKYAPIPQGSHGPGGFVAPGTGIGGVAGVQSMARGLNEANKSRRNVGDDDTARDPYIAYHPLQSQSPKPPASELGPGGFTAYRPEESKQEQSNQSWVYPAATQSQQQHAPTSSVPTSGSIAQGSGYDSPSHSTASTLAPQLAGSGYQPSPSYEQGLPTSASSQQSAHGNQPTGQYQSLSASSFNAPVPSGGYQSSAGSLPTTTTDSGGQGYDGTGPPPGAVEAPGYIPGYGDTQSPPPSLQQPIRQPYGQQQPQQTQSGGLASGYAATAHGANVGPQQPQQSGLLESTYDRPAVSSVYGQYAVTGAQHNKPYSQQPVTQTYGANALVPPPAEAQQLFGQSTNTPSTGLHHRYQADATQLGAIAGSSKHDSVAQCYMANGEDIRKVPWEQAGGQSEIDSFVSEELYIHSKVLVVDDRKAIIGSANLNDRSQLGDHDSEIACIIEDSNLVDSTMNGRPWKAGRFVASLRRSLFRKHIGLLNPQDCETPTNNFYPVSLGFGTTGAGSSENDYDWGSAEDLQVADPLDQRFENLWNTIAHNNTEAFAKLFHPVPYDGVRTWQQYEDWYERYFRPVDSKDVKEGRKPAGKYLQCHVVKETFGEGEAGARAVKEELSKIRGTLVEMPLVFLKDEDIAKEGLGLNAFTEEVYT